jgi:hypothetical protein
VLASGHDHLPRRLHGDGVHVRIGGEPPRGENELAVDLGQGGADGVSVAVGEPARVQRLVQ